MLLLVPSAFALTLSLQDETTVATGVTVREYRASNPDTDVWVALIDLCADGVYLDATRATTSTQSTGSWGADQGVVLATNGDFYKTDPLRVYGDAVGAGVRWPAEQTGRDSAYASEWYYEHYGWIAFGPDWVDFTHTGWVKENVGGLTQGWSSDLIPELRPGTLELVSGFPELVIEGTRVDCSSPTADDCFPDRSDMRDRNPRTAMGLTEDRSTFILAVVDGRTGTSEGMYGEELAELMAELGAWEAFNLDGGGSSQLWTGDYLNDIDGNNSGAGTRSVTNHWGVFADDDRLPARPGHCATAPPCGVIGSAGGTIDDTDACFRALGPSEYWRTESSGEGGSLHWTNAWDDTSPDNWAWWQINLAQAGTYTVDVSVDDTYGVFDNTHYDVRGDGVVTTLHVDQGAASGWVTLGTFSFAAGGDQWVAVYDDSASDPGSNQHVTADAMRLTRVGGGDTGDTGGDPGDSGGDTASDSAGDSAGDSADSATGDTGMGLPGTPSQVKDGGCGCASSPSGRGAWWIAVGALGALALRGRRATASRRSSASGGSSAR